MAQDRNGLFGRIGPVQIDIPRTLGYFGGAAAGVAFGVIEAPLGLVIAAAPFARLLNSPRRPQPTRFVGEVIEGAVAPIGGEDDGIITAVSKDGGAQGSRGGSSQRNGNGRARGSGAARKRAAARSTRTRRRNTQVQRRSS